MSRMKDRVAALEEQHDNDPNRIMSEYLHDLHVCRAMIRRRLEQLFRDHARPDQAERVAAAVKWREDCESLKVTDDRLDALVLDIAFGKAVLPDDISGEAVRALIDLFLGPRAVCDNILGACDQCGLARPIPLTEPDEAWTEYLRSGQRGPRPVRMHDVCPHCRHTTWTWSTRVFEVTHPWHAHAMSVKSLDQRHAEAAVGERN
jgi:hypothetical protein